MAENRTRTAFLESFLQLDVPEPAFDRGKRFIVAVLEGGGDKGRIFVEHVLHPKRERRVIKPGVPATGVVLSSGDGESRFSPCRPSSSGFYLHPWQSQVPRPERVAAG
jgi:hypothetical protein